MKIGIYTIHAHYNYGAMFQAYATQKALEKLGHEAELVNVYTKKEEFENEYRIFSFKPKQFVIYLYSKLNPKVRLKFKRFREFHANMKLSRRYCTVEEIYTYPPKYDIHLVGSDQVWNLEKGFPSNPYYFLDFLGSNDIKIAFASSFGASQIDKNYEDKLKSLISSFKAIAIREDEGVAIIEKATGIKATQVLDPTFLLDEKEWSELDGSNKALVEGEYVFCYGFDGSDKSKEMIESIREKLKLPIVVVSVSIFFPFKVDKFIQEAGPREFINLVKNAKFVCSSSYHGIAFAIHFKKNFFSTKHPSRNSRMLTMLKKVNLIDRQLENPKDILQMSDEQLAIDYQLIENEIEKATDSSKSWLDKNTKWI
jgi:hypothetical protein